MAPYSAYAGTLRLDGPTLANLYSKPNPFWLVPQVAPYSAYAGALRLDGPTLANLELLENCCGASEGSLMACLDTCASPGAHLALRRPVDAHRLLCILAEPCMAHSGLCPFG